MKPDNIQLLHTISSTLGSDIYPRLDSSYHQSILSQMIELLIGIAADFDQAAASLVEENQKYRELFRNCLGYVTDTTLKTRLTEACETTDTDLHIKALDKTNQELTRLSIELQTHLESIDTEKTSELSESIWQELTVRAMRRLMIITQGANAAQIAPLNKRNQ